MSFAIAPEFVTGAASDLANVGSAINAANAAAAAQAAAESCKARETESGWSGGTRINSLQRPMHAPSVPFYGAWTPAAGKVY